MPMSAGAGPAWLIVVTQVWRVRVTRALLVVVALAITAGCVGATPPTARAGGAPAHGDGDDTSDVGGSGDSDGDRDDGDGDGDRDDGDGAPGNRDDHDRAFDDRTSRDDRDRAGAGHDRALDDRDGRADRADDRDDFGLVRGSLRGGPPVSEVLAAAYAAAELDRELGSAFSARARLGGLVPWVSVRTGRDASWHDEAPDVGRGTTLEVRATWRLDRLMFDPRELQVVALEAARRRERRRLATHVIRTYFAWKRSGSRADEAGAELDALTNGWFSEALQRGASETRTVRAPVATP